MISYELAKQLKEAGFPQPAGSYKTADGNWAYIPTLAELIESFPKDEILNFHYYPKKDGNKWMAYYKGCFEMDAESKPYFITKGKTPEEAVAKLWLALNKRKQCNGNKET